MSQYCFARCRLSASSVVVCNAAGVRSDRPPGALTVGAPATGNVGGRHCTAGQYGYVLLGRHLVLHRFDTENAIPRSNDDQGKQLYTLSGKSASIFLPLTLPNSDRFSKSFTDRLSSKFVVQQ